jgi:hypothetical protein
MTATSSYPSSYSTDSKEVIYKRNMPKEIYASQTITKIIT